MTRPDPRITAICIEVAGPEQMETWLDAGWMPNLARIRDQGAWCRLRSVSDISSGSIWPSFSTGVMPSRHGQFFTHMQLESGSYRVVKKYADDLPRAPFWDLLDRARKRSAVIDVPQSRPVPGFAGVHVAGWGGEYPAWPRSSEPPALMPEILRRFGRHPLAEQYRLVGKPETEAAYEALRRDLLEGARTKASLSRWILEREPYDLFLTVFAETHWAMHLLWDMIDPQHPDHNPQLARRHAISFREICSTIDAFIGEAWGRRPDSALVVFSLSGMGANYSGWHVLPEVLTRLELGPAGKGTAPGVQWSPLRRWGPWTMRAIENLASPRLIETAKAVVPGRLWDRWTRRLIFAGSGWRDSRAFWLPNDYSGAIRINLKGREPNGVVAPGAEYDSLCRDLADAMLELVNIDTGRPAVAEVLRTREALPGECVDDLPDLLVVWASDTPIRGVRSPKVGEIRCVSPERRTGAHRRDGFLAATGGGFAAGARCEGARIVDLAPTLLRLLDVEPPGDWDGRVLASLLSPNPGR
jgi:predicted AlkP superfamily phosphohydrolase/phosphomutase